MKKSSSRGFPRPIDSALHGQTDYMVGTLLMTAFPKLAGIEGTRSARQIRISGAAHAGYSLFTNYELGAVKVLPYKAHLGLDLAGALALGATPFVTGQWKKGRKHFVPHLGLMAFELVSLLFSDPTGKGDYKADVEAVREANMEDPNRQIREEGLAVTPAVAVAGA